MACSVLTGDLTFTSLKPLDVTSCSKQQIRDYFENSYCLNESLFVSLKDESVFYQYPDRLRLPLIFYYTHTAAVYVNKLILAGLIQERVNKEFETLFETGVDEMSWDDTENYRIGGSFQWPSLKEVVAYRQKVKDVILQVIENTPLHLPINMNSQWWALLMGMEHERIHLETSSVLIRQLPVHMVSRPEGWMYGPAKTGTPVTENPMLRVEEQEVEVGKPVDFPSYGWDNEYGQVHVHVPTFRASKFLVTNREYLKFVQAGGYTCEDLWSKEGWRWRQFTSKLHPVFWVCNRGCSGGCGGELKNYSHCQAEGRRITGGDNSSGGEFRLRLMFDVVDLPMDWPVEVNYHEAKAYCSWRGPQYRLTTEAEQHVLRQPLNCPSDRAPYTDVIYQDSIEANLNLQYGSSTPVNLYGGTALGFHDVHGNVWEWLEDHFNGLPGFHTHWLYDDFSSPCFDGKHNMILGGSWVSTGDSASQYARFAFRRHFFQHLGFRMAESIGDGENTELPARVIGTEVFVVGQGSLERNSDEYGGYKVQRVETTNLNYTYDDLPSLGGILELEFGFRDSGVGVAADVCMEVVRQSQINTQAAVHIGAGSGRAAFQLTNLFEQVLGVEPVGRFADAALRLQHQGYINYTGQDGTGHTVKLADYTTHPDRVVFKQLTWIPNEVESHDLVLLSHLERIQNPKAWLMRVWEITRPAGLAVVVSVSGQYDANKLTPMLGDRMVYVSEQQYAYQTAVGREEGVITIWQRQQ